MEQKQLDEIDETFFGEEFVDDETSVTIQSAKDGPKNINSKKNQVTVKKKVVTPSKAPAKKNKIETKHTKSAGKHFSKEISPKIEIVENHSAKNDIKIEPVKSPLERIEPVEISSPVNPWAEEKNTTSNQSLFAETSTWKAITGIVIILLLVSIFTQGFRFYASSSSGSELSLEEAEVKALDYVNTKLLQPPYVAEVEFSQAVEDLYLVRLSVAGQSVDSYITKDGSLFFPQGFDTSKSLEEQAELNAPEVSLDVDTNAADKNTVDDTTGPSDVAADTNNVEAAVVGDTSSDSVPVEEPFVPAPAETTAKVVEVKMTSKKWIFSPRKVTVDAGSQVKLVITPDNSNPSFALPKYTFSIPQLSISKSVSGPTTIEFTPKAPGSYPFSCGDCEDWRGMNGILVVQ